MTSDVSHVSVMRERCIELLTPAIISSENPVIVDATLGLGGHTEALLSKFPALKVIGIDRDEDALARATNRLAPFSERLRTSHACFDQISEVVKETVSRSVVSKRMGSNPIPRKFFNQQPPFTVVSSYSMPIVVFIKSI